MLFPHNSRCTQRNHKLLIREPGALDCEVVRSPSLVMAAMSFWFSRDVTPVVNDSNVRHRCRHIIRVDCPMHPPLHLHKHPHCKELINALNKCHADHPVAKFWGVCNDQKFALDRCFRQEKRINSAINRKKAKDFQEKYQRSLAEAAAEKQASQQTA